MSTQTNAVSNETGTIGAIVLSPKMEAVKAISSWALAAFAEEVTRQTGKLAGASYDDLKTYRKALGISEGPARVIVQNDRKVAAEKSVKELRERLNTAFLADDSPEQAAELATVKPLLKAAIAELQEAEKVDTAASTLRALELNCTGGQPYSYSSKRIADIARSRYETALAALSAVNVSEVDLALAAAMANKAAYETLLARDVLPIQTTAKLAIKQGELTTAKAQLETAKKELAEAKDADKAAKEAEVKKLGAEIGALKTEVQALQATRDSEVAAQAGEPAKTE